jgi:hypothetical protein
LSLPSRFPIKILCAFLLASMHVACHAHLMFGEEYKLWISSYCTTGKTQAYVGW